MLDSDGHFVFLSKRFRNPNEDSIKFHEGFKRTYSLNVSYVLRVLYSPTLSREFASSS